MKVGGWCIQTKTTPILGREQLEALEGRLGTSHLPEMVYGSTLELRHLASGTRLHFNAEDALKEWLDEGLPPLKVAAAAEWAKGHKLRFGDELPPPASSTKPSAGDGGRGRSIRGGGGGGKDGWDDTESHETYDWTFTTPYRGSVDTATGRSDVESVGQGVGPEDGDASEMGPPPPSPPPDWEDTEERVDRSMLMERDPILFFDELTLYESELDDNGEMSLSLKVRVMPRCWFILMRFWMRVDGVLIRLRETRFFSRMTPPPTIPPGLPEEKRAALAASLAANASPAVVVRESARREETFQALKVGGGGEEVEAHPRLLCFRPTHRTYRIIRGC